MAGSSARSAVLEGIAFTALILVLSCLRQRHERRGFLSRPAFLPILLLLHPLGSLEDEEARTLVAIGLAHQPVTG